MRQLLIICTLFLCAGTASAQWTRTQVPLGRLEKASAKGAFIISGSDSLAVWADSIWFDGGLLITPTDTFATQAYVQANESDTDSIYYKTAAGIALATRGDTLDVQKLVIQTTAGLDHITANDTTTLSLNFSEIGVSPTIDGDAQLIVYLPTGDIEARYDLQGVFSNILTSPNGTLDITEISDNQIGIDVNGDSVALQSDIDSTRLIQDSILVYYQYGSEIGRDTISGLGGGGGSSITDNTTEGHLPYKTSGAFENSPMLINGNKNAATDSTFIFARGDNSIASNEYTQLQFNFGLEKDSVSFSHYIRTRHNSVSANDNAIEFYTSDGTQAGTFPANAIHALTLENGKAGISTTSPMYTLDINGTVGANGPVFLNGLSAGTAFDEAAVVNSLTKEVGYVDRLWYQNSDVIYHNPGGNGSRLAYNIADTDLTGGQGIVFSAPTLKDYISFEHRSSSNHLTLRPQFGYLYSSQPFRFYSQGFSGRGSSSGSQLILYADDNDFRIGRNAPATGDGIMVINSSGTSDANNYNLKLLNTNVRNDDILISEISSVQSGHKNTSNHYSAITSGVEVANINENGGAYFAGNIQADTALFNRVDIGEDYAQARQLSMKGSDINTEMFEYNSGGTAMRLRMYKSRGTESTPQSIANDTETGGLMFHGMGNNGSFWNTAFILSKGTADATAGGTGKLEFRVMDDQLTGTPPVQMQYNGATDGWGVLGNMAVEKVLTIDSTIHSDSVATTIEDSDRFFLEKGNRLTEITAQNAADYFVSQSIESARNYSATTSGTGSITISHSLGVIPSVTITNASATPYVFSISSVTTTNFTIFVYDMSGSSVNSTSVNFDYQLIIP